MKHTLFNLAIGILLVVIFLCIFPWAAPIAALAGVWHFIGWLFRPDE